MNAAPAVSIAIRAFRRTWLDAAIASVLGQTWRDLELIVYDDAGDLEDVVARFDDPRVRYVRAEQKLEASGRFAAAVALCRGRTIGLLDDDDRYEPAFIERLAEALDSDPRAGAAFCRDRDVSMGRRRPRRRSLGPPGRQQDVLRRMFTERWVVAPSSMLLRREALEDIEPMPDGVSPDVFLAFHLAHAGWHHVLVDDVLVVRRWHDANLSRTIVVANYMVATLERLQTADSELETLRRRELVRRILVRAAFRLVEGDRRNALADVRAARETDPSAHHALRSLVQLAAALPLLGPLAARIARALRA
ncbi:MAG TPA: glycosyltransferase family 2 protein [Thermoanaerobaculia bacterium]|nr:glycosyltransferase family 2 protein [Thermoanaerobaculia bacterium]